MATRDEISDIKSEIAEVKAMLQEHLSVANVIDGNVKSDVKRIFVKLEKIYTDINELKTEAVVVKTKVAVLETENKIEKETWKTVAKWVSVIVGILSLAFLLVQKLLP